MKIILKQKILINGITTREIKKTVVKIIKSPILSLNLKPLIFITVGGVTRLHPVITLSNI